MSEETKFRIGDETLEEFFEPAKGHKPITRRQMRAIMMLMASKASVHEAMQVLEFNLRQSLRGMIDEEREKAAEQTKSGILLLP